ncbi:alpha/beta hydrolase [Biostraticola tofi]|nr:alpha/beta fold hydrolase [Biostraticola tofi]
MTVLCLKMRWAILPFLLLLTACRAAAPTWPSPDADSFVQYQQQSRQQLESHRRFQTPDRQAEIGYNQPREWRPQGQPKGGMLLIHGLGDSPYSFSDIGPVLAAKGYLVRTLLLPGHGTKPEDLMAVSLEDWHQLIQRQTDIMRREVPHVWLGGFSTGANLATKYAVQHHEIAGLILFSPAFSARNQLVWLTPWLRPFKDWLRKPDGSRPLQTSVRYMNTPTNGFALFYRTSRQAKSQLRHAGHYAKPVMIITVAHDSVLDTAYTLAAFQRYFTHPGSRLYWYGDLPAGVPPSPRIRVKPDALPRLRISQFSHMGILFAPDNPLYGESAREKFCWNGQEESALKACLAGQEVWYSDWGYQERDKVHARLTFNPYWDEQNLAISAFLSQGTPLE